MSDTDNKPQIISRAEAKALGLKHYLTGVPCKHGHIAKRRVSTRACTECRAFADKARYEANPEKYRTTYKAYREANPEKCRAAEKAWREANPEKRRATDKARYEANHEKYRAAHKAYREANPEKRRGAVKAWQKANPEKYRAIKKAGKHVRRARKRAAPGRWTPQDIQDILVAQFHSCAGCDAMFYEDQSYHIDHMIPLSRGGSNWPSNLQILCPSCNCSKHDLADEEWRASARFNRTSAFTCT